ncbi:MAG: leucine-rich repeat protein, partial [Thermoguttaceae bacterium]|nr:leucine-rich repeat protein [Thermoguttaceae bacterium]
ETLTDSDKTTMENAARDIVLRRKEQIPDFQSNVAILNSCKEGQSAYEWDDRQHGLFTAHLLDAMEKSSNSVMQIASYISSNIEKTALELGKEQTPFYKLEGDIVLPVKTKSTPLVTGDVFISYRHCNADLVAPVEEELKRRGISYFIDRVGVNYSMNYSKVIAQAIKACKVLLVMWTKEANGSADMLKEIVMADQLKKRVLPYKLGSFDVTEHDDLFYQLSTLSRCEAAEPTPDSVTELINHVELLLPRKNVEPERPASNPPETSKDEDVQKKETEDNRAADTPAPNEAPQAVQNNNPQSTNWSSFELDTTLRKFIGKETEVVIPEGVTVIGEKAFKDCDTITSVVIPKGVTKIERYAFEGCSSLTSVEIPDSVTVIRESVFRGCSSLTSVVIPKGVTYIGEYVFFGCSSLTSVVIPKNVTSIGVCAFSSCKSLTSVAMPDCVAKIGSYAFEGCSSLTSVAIPERLSNIGYGAFGNCTALKEWTISSNHPHFKRDGAGLLTKDGKTLVVCLASAKEYKIPEGVAKIESYAFFRCSSLMSVVISEGVTKIGESAFQICNSLISVEIPDSLTVIGELAFYGCSSLTSIEIPESVVEIDNDAFRSCSKLTFYAPAGSKAEEYAKNNDIPFKAK